MMDGEQKLILTLLISAALLLASLIGWGMTRTYHDAEIRKELVEKCYVAKAQNCSDIWTTYDKS